MPRAWVLGIDFGTSFTVVAGRAEGQPPEIVDVTGLRRMPSVVFVDDNGQIVVGEFAERMLASHPEAALRTPKARLGDASPVVLAGRPRQPTELVAAVLRTCVSSAVDHFGSPPARARLTYPAAWSRSRISKLDEAARLAGLTDPSFVPEPVAAAVAYWQRGELADGAHVGVYDLGGGTFDTAVLRATAGRFEIVGRPGGDVTVGGEMFDELVVQEIGSRLPPGDWEAIQLSGDAAWSHARAALHTEARLARETLSSRPSVDLAIALPSGIRSVRLGRDDLEAMLEPYVRDTIDALTRCVHDAGLDPQQLTALQLVGGVSRTPIVERMVTEAFPGIPIQRRGDPKASVALGATLVDDAAAAPIASAGRSTPTPTPTPTLPPTPTTTPTTVPTLLPTPTTVPTPTPTLPPTPTPTLPVALPARPAAAPGAPPPPPPRHSPPPPPPAAPAAPVVGPPPTQPVPVLPMPAAKRRRWVPIAFFAAAAAIAVGAAVVVVTSGGDNDRSSTPADDPGSTAPRSTRPDTTAASVTTAAPDTATSTATTGSVSTSSVAATSTSAPPATAGTTAGTTPGTPSPTPAPTPAPIGGVSVPVTGRLAFVSARDGDDDIYLMRPDGTDIVQLTNSPDTDTRPAFSPDGTMIAFASKRDDTKFEIYVMRADGTNVRRLTSNPDRDVEPTWSPDGTRIAFSSRRAGSTDIYVMDVSGGSLVRLTTAEGAEGEPAWSPDGTRIAFNRRVGEGKYTLFVMNADGSGEQQISDGLDHAYSPSWSPDGSRLVFSSGDGDDAELVVVTPGASGSAVYLTSNGVGEFWPAWSPDGTRIVFTSGADAEDREVRVMRADGSDVQSLTSNGVKDQLAAWSP